MENKTKLSKRKLACRLILGCLFLCFVVYAVIGVIFSITTVESNMRMVQCVPGGGCYTDPRIGESIILGVFWLFFVGGKLIGKGLSG